MADGKTHIQEDSHLGCIARGHCMMTCPEGAISVAALGSTMIGGAPPILQRNKALCERLGIPSGNIPAMALILGHPATHFRHAVQRRFASFRLPDLGRDLG